MPTPSAPSVKEEQTESEKNENDLDKASVGGSTVAGSSRQTLAKRKEKLLATARDWVKTLKPKLLLEGVDNRHRVWQMQQALEALQRMGDKSADTVLLKAHEELCVLAADCSCHKIERKSKTPFSLNLNFPLILCIQCGRGSRSFCDLSIKLSWMSSLG